MLLEIIVTPGIQFHPHASVLTEDRRPVVAHIIPCCTYVRADISVIEACSDEIRVE
jgi:hypothetical protein